MYIVGGFVGAVVIMTGGIIWWIRKDWKELKADSERMKQQEKDEEFLMKF